MDLQTWLQQGYLYIEWLTIGHADGAPIQPHEVYGDLVLLLGELGFLLYLYPELQDDADLQAFFVEAGDTLGRLHHLLIPFVDEMERLLQETASRDDWASACQRRSALHFITEIALETGIDNEFVARRTPHWDNMITQERPNGVYLAAEDIPDGMPPNHWWWWYPNHPA